MNKTERNKATTKAVYLFVNNMFPWLEIDQTDYDVSFIDTESNNQGNDSIQYRRSNQTLAWLNWSNDRIKDAGERIEKFIELMEKMDDSDIEKLTQ